jgi:hypothetical protein
MGLFRRPPAPPAPEPMFAVPLTPAETGRLVEAMRENDRLGRIYGESGLGYESEIAAIINRAGIAAALGHPVVPHLVTDLRSYDTVLRRLQERAPHRAITQNLIQLVNKMRMLAAAARLRGWTVRWDETARGCRWTAVPTDARQETTPADDVRPPAAAALAGGAGPTALLAARLRDVEENLAVGNARLAVHALRQLAAAAAGMAQQLDGDAVVPATRPGDRQSAGDAEYLARPD